MNWIFDGIGTSIIELLLSFVFGNIVGGFIIYNKYVKKKVIKQNQKARDNLTQVQIGDIYGKK